MSRHRCGQGGMTLIEVLVSMMLAAVLVIALANGLLTSVTSNNGNRAVQETNAMLTSFGDSLKELAYKECADPGWYQALFADLLAGTAPADRFQKFGVSDVSQVQVTKVEYWRPPAPTTSLGQRPTNGTFEEACEEDGGTQLITFTARKSATSGFKRHGQIVKRNPEGMGYEEYIAPTTTLREGNVPPRASFTAVHLGNGEYEFTSTATDSPPGTVTEWSWDFDDNTVPATTEDVTHTFGPGVFKVRLRVTDNEGATSSASQTITIAGVPGVVQNFRLIRVRHGGGTSAIYDYGWTAIPGVQQYEITTRWCDPLDWFGCTSPERHLFGDVSGASIAVDFPYVPFYRASIRARVGDQWGPMSPEISGWRP